MGEQGQRKEEDGEDFEEGGEIHGWIRGDLDGSLSWSGVYKAVFYSSVTRARKLLAVFLPERFCSSVLRYVVGRNALKRSRCQSLPS